MLPDVKQIKIPPSRYAVSTMGYMFLQIVKEDQACNTYMDDLRNNIIGELEPFFQALDDFPGEAKKFIRDLNQELDGGCYRDYVGEFFSQSFYDNLIESVKHLASEKMAAQIIASFEWMKREGLGNG